MLARSCSLDFDPDLLGPADVCAAGDPSLAGIPGRL